MNLEYRIRYRFREAGAERTRVFKTEKGARRYLDKVTSNNGIYKKRQEGWNGEEHGFYTEDWHLEYAHLEVREVEEWVDYEDYNKLTLACGCDYGAHENSLTTIREVHPEISFVPLIEGVEYSPRFYVARQ